MVHMMDNMASFLRDSNTIDRMFSGVILIDEPVNEVWNLPLVPVVPGVKFGN